MKKKQSNKTLIQFIVFFVIPFVGLVIFCVAVGVLTGEGPREEVYNASIATSDNPNDPTIDPSLLIQSEQSQAQQAPSPTAQPSPTPTPKPKSAEQESFLFGVFAICGGLFLIAVIGAGGFLLLSPTPTKKPSDSEQEEPQNKEKEESKNNQPLQGNTFSAPSLTTPPPQPEPEQPTTPTSEPPTQSNTPDFSPPTQPATAKPFEPFDFTKDAGQDHSASPSSQEPPQSNETAE